QLVAEHPIALGVDHGRSVSLLDQPAGNPCLADGLARAGGSYDQRVRARGIADGDRYRHPLAVLTEHEPSVLDPPLTADRAPASMAADHVRNAQAGTSGLCEVRPVGKVVVMPCGSKQAGEQAGAPERQGDRAAAEQQVGSGKAECCPAPAQASLAQSACEQEAAEEDD